MASSLHGVAGQLNWKLRNLLPTRASNQLRLGVGDTAYNRVEERSVGRSLSGRGTIHPIYTIRMLVRHCIRQEVGAFPITFSASGPERRILEKGGAW